MPTLTINYNQLSYSGTFAQPAFDLLAGKLPGGGLYNVFSPFGIGLHSIFEEGAMASPGTLAINIYLGDLGNYKLRLDSVEWKVINFSEEVIPRFPEVLKGAADWLRSSVSEFAFKKHVFVYNAHCALSEGNSKDFLLSLGYKSPLVLGEELGNGLIHNWFSKELAASIQFMLDRSTPVEGGLFVQFILMTDNDNVDYQMLAEKGYGILVNELNALGLDIEREKEVKS
jgi:hypothetical protein